MKDEREMSGPSSGDGITTLKPSQDNTGNAKNLRGRFSRRGFIGQSTAMLAAAFGGLWALANPRRAAAFGLSGGTEQNQQLRCPVGEPCSPPPPPPNYTVQSEALINNVCAAYNAHDAATLVSHFDSSTIDTATLQTHLQNTFHAFPQTSITVNSMTAGALGLTITLNWTIAHDYTTATSDPLVNANGVVPVQTDTVTGQTVFDIITGSLIYNMDTTHNIPPVFAAHGATVAP